MALDYPGLLSDLRVESDVVIKHVTALADSQWTLPTPAQGWTIHDQVSHLAFFDDSTILALSDAPKFGAHAAALMATGMDFPDRIAEKHRALAPAKLLNWFVDSRQRLLSALALENPRRRVPWFGPDMSVASSATARLMETWAHGQDIYDARELPHQPGPGLRGIAHLGVATFGFSHTVHGLPVPSDPVRVDLRSPTDELWTWGPPDATNTIAGSATDFVLTVTQRRHWRQTGLVARGDVAAGWLDIAQAFAGAPSTRQAPPAITPPAARQ